MRNRTLATLLVGLAARIELASFAGHPVDMTLLAYSSRLYYETGRFDILFPSLPLIYYIQLPFYSLYVLARNAGIPDTAFLYHSTFMLEGLFLRLPIILADAATFAVLLRYTGKLRYAAFYFLNPFTIYLTGAWGMYDSLMMFPMVVGFVSLARDNRRLASVSFAISGLLKLFGFIPFALLGIENLLQRRFREFAIQVGLGLALTLVVFAPYFQSGLEGFYVGFVLRFLGLSGARTRVYNIFSALSGVRFGGSSPYLWLGAAIVPGIFLLERARSKSSFRVILLPTIVSAVILDIFSQSEPQWLSWIIPLSLLYAFATHRDGLASYSYFFGVMCTVLTTTLLQTSGYLVEGIPFVLFKAFEGIPGGLLVYSITIIGLLFLLLGYTFSKPVRFKIEIPTLVVIVYLQAYFWFSVMRVVSV